MERSAKGKRQIFLIVCMLLLSAVLAGCKKEQSYAGGHIAVSYDTDSWELSYQEAEPYPVFDLHSEEADIIIMLIENDGSVLESFHNDMRYLWDTEEEIVEKGRTDKWDEEGIFYYEDFMPDEEEAWYLITYGKRQEDKLIIGYAEILSEESEEENIEVKSEVLNILDSMSYSEQEEIGNIEKDKEYESIVFIYDMLNNLIRYEGVSDNGTDEESGDGQAAFSDGDIKNLKYIEQISVEDYYGDKSIFDTYGPKGSDCEEGYVYYFEHGLFYSASAYSGGTNAFLYGILDEMIKYTQEEWMAEDSGYSDVEIGETMKNGDDRYIIATAKRDDYNGVFYETKIIYYLDVAEPGSGVLWQLEMEEINVDDETDLIIDELAGCYGISLDQLKASGKWSEDDKERARQEQDQYDPGEDELILEKVEGYQYMGVVTIKAQANRKDTQCQVMAPMGQSTSASDNYVGANMHGIKIRAGIDMMLQQNLMANVKFSSDICYENYLEDKEDIRNVLKSEMIPITGFEEAYYVVITYEERDYITEEFVDKADVLCFIRIDENFELEYYITFSPNEYDDSTNIVIKELETAYGIDLSEYYYEDKVSGQKKRIDENKEEADGPVTMAQLMGGNSAEKESRDTEPLSDTILWFNATYAPLTYSNGWNWKLISGLEQTESNIELQKALLRNSWDIRDRESALETIEWLKEEGHRESCRSYMEELEQMGLLELEEEEFLDEFKEMGAEKNGFRYVMAYYMYQEGVEPDYIAAWDLCRVNQLYADCYFCGYMTYEEAMDGSLENSLLLQQMYSSWEEMADAYMTGYQFWQSDPCLTDDSPTMERYRYYEMLLEKKDGPYTLDWDMELEKSW